MRKIAIIFGLIFSIFVLDVSNVFASDLNQEGNFNNIVIFIKFADEDTYSPPFDYNYYDNMFNGVDVVSLRDYFQEVTYNQLLIDSYLINSGGDTILFYTDVYDRGYFEPYSGLNPIGYDDGEETEREHQLLKRAVDYVDLNNLVPDELVLDTNDDGEIDSITFMVSGEDSGWSSLLWPHKWELYTQTNAYGEFLPDAPTINGVNAYIYTFELLGNSNHYTYRASVGILAHETFHLLSATDLYHYYQYLNIDPVGTWGLMEINGTIPSHMLGYMKYEYGNWITDVSEITSSGNYTLYPLQDSADNLYKIDTGVSNEWVYLEYRDNEGLYESNLDDSGLIVYRVDLDFEGQGNMDGYYNEFGEAVDEVFIFRPGMKDTVAPYTFLDDGDSLNDGYYQDAALSQYNDYDEMGIGTDIPMFFSSGDEMQMKVYNVTEYDGYINFDIYIPAIVTLDVKGDGTAPGNLVLLDSEDMSYHASIENVSPGNDIYYTVDGSTPDMTDTLYTGASFEISATNNVVKIAVYDGTTLLSYNEKEFIFESTIESNHFPYGNNVNKTWYLEFSSVIDFSLTFSAQSYLEDSYDYVSIYTDFVSYSYTGSEMASEIVNLNTDYAFVNLYSDEWLDEYYGFSLELDAVQELTLNIAGEANINHAVNTTYVDQGAYLSGPGKLEYFIETVDTVDEYSLGTYSVTYNVINSLFQVVLTDSRIVNVIDNIKPVITINGASTIYLEYQEAYIELGAVFTDNYDAAGVAVVGGDTVNTSVLGSYVVTYNVTDSEGNVATQVTRTVIVRDTIAPEINVIGDMTVYVEAGDVYTELGAEVLDNYDPIGMAVVGGDTVITSILGEYTITYNITDSEGNVASEVTRIVIVRDTTAPVINLIGDETVYVEFGDDYTEVGGIATDNYDSDSLPTIGGDTVLGTVLGTYIITYNITDSEGNAATEVTRTVVVRDTTAPIVSLNPSFDSLIMGSEYNETGVTVFDLADYEIVISGLVDLTQAGTYIVTYTVTDENDNVSIALRYVVVSGNIPVFSLGDANTTLMVGEEYIDGSCLVVVGTEEFDCTVKANNVDNTNVGIYTITYSYTIDDKEYTYQRYVFVYDATEKPTLYYRKEEGSNLV